MKFHDLSGGKASKGINYSDIVQTDNGYYQVRGDGHRKQLYFLASTWSGMIAVLKRG